MLSIKKGILYSRDMTSNVQTDKKVESATSDNPKTPSRIDQLKPHLPEEGSEEKAAKDPDIELIRKELGLEDSSAKEDEETRVRRQMEKKQALDSYLDRLHNFRVRRDYETKYEVQEQSVEQLKHQLRENDQIKFLELRTKAVEDLEARGVQNAEKLVELFEYSEFSDWIRFGITVSGGGYTSKYKLVDDEGKVALDDWRLEAFIKGFYNSLLDPKVLRLLKSVGQNPEGLKRFFELGGDASLRVIQNNFDLQHTSFVANFLSKLSQIPEEDFNKVKLQLLKHNYLLSTRLFELLMINPYEIKEHRGYKKTLYDLVDFIGKGGISDKDLEVFEAYTLMSRITGDNIVKLDSSSPTLYQRILDSRERILGAKVFLEQAGYEWAVAPQFDKFFSVPVPLTTTNAEHYQGYMIPNLRYMQQYKQLPILNTLINRGFNLGFPLIKGFIEEEYSDKYSFSNLKETLRSAQEMLHLLDTDDEFRDMFQLLVDLGYVRKSINSADRTVRLTKFMLRPENKKILRNLSQVIARLIPEDMDKKTTLKRLLQIESNYSKDKSPFEIRVGINLDRRERISEKEKEALVKILHGFNFVMSLNDSEEDLADSFFNKSSLDFLRDVLKKKGVNYLRNINNSDDLIYILSDDVRKLWMIISPLYDDEELEDLLLNKPEKIDDIAKLNNQILNSASKELRRFHKDILIQILGTENPYETFKKLESVFILNNLPEIGKIYRVFEIMHPSGAIERKIGNRKWGINGQAQPSPVLLEAGPRRKYDIIYRDLLKVHIDSANPSLYRYLKTLQEGQVLVDKAESAGIESLNPQTELPQLVRFLNRMDALYNNSLYGRRIGDHYTKSENLLERIRGLEQAFGVAKGQKLTERIAQMFVKPLGYQNLDQVIQRMETIKSSAHQRNIEFYEQALRGNNGKLKIQAGDLLKGTREEYLEVFFRNGSVAKEFLGSDASSDTTPFDTDTSMVLPEHITKNYTDLIGQSLVHNYGNLVILFKNRGQFIETSQENPQYETGKYELFMSGYHGKRHFAVRTGISSTEIDALIFQGDLAVNRSEQERIFFDIAQNGFYIPVIDVEGRILFTPEDYEHYKLKVAEVHEVLDSVDFTPHDLIEIYKQSPYMKRLYDASAGVHEGYSLQQHTEMMMDQFEKYFSSAWSSPLISKNNFRITLSLHDLGKPLAVQRTGRTTEQHEYTIKFIPHILDTLGFGEKEAEIATAVIDQDFLGDYFKGAKSAEEIARDIKNKASELGVSLQDLMELLRIYYTSDAGSYTADAGGQASLDRLFKFMQDPETNRRVVKFAEDIQGRYGELLNQVYLAT